MGTITLPDELQHLIDRQVAEARAADPAAFLEEAVRRLVGETLGEERSISQAVEAGSADIAAGYYVTVSTPDDEQRVHDGMVARLRARLFAGS